MAHHNGKRNGKASSEQIDRLRDWMELARLHGNPEPTEEEREKVPQTLAFLAPELIDDPDYKGLGSARKVLREPMLMVTWDRAAGRWKWSITDRVCRVQVSGFFDSLVAFSERIEQQLMEKNVMVKELDPTRRREV